MGNDKKQTGPVYGVELIDALPIGDTGMRQAMPGRKDLEQVRKSNERVAAGYEVLLAHYQELKQNQRDWIHYKTELPPDGVPVLFCNVSASDEYDDQPEIGIWAGEELGSALAAECDHEWEVFDESFDHEYGRETDICEMCIRCGLERGTFGSAAWDHLTVIHDGARKAVKAGSNPARSIVTPHLPWVEPEEDGCVQQKVSSELQS